jgi:predicted permease
MFKRLIKNPVIIAVIAGLIVYAYMAWNRKKENEKRLKK